MRSTSSNGSLERKPTRMPRSSASGESCACHSPSSRSAAPRAPARHRPPGRPARRGAICVDHRRQRGELPVVGRLVRRPAVGAREEQVLEVPRRDRQRHPSKACSWRRTASRSHAGSSPESSTLRRRPSSAATMRRMSSSGADASRPTAAQAAAPLAVGRRAPGESAQLDLQAVERDGDVALGRHLPDQPVRELLGPGRGVELGVAEPVGDLRRSGRPRARRSSAARPRGCRPWSRSARSSRTARRRPPWRRAGG